MDYLYDAVAGALVTTGRTLIALFGRLHDFIATARAERTVHEATTIWSIIERSISAAVVALLGAVLDAVAAVRCMLTIRRTAAVRPVVDFVIAGFRCLNDTITTNGRDTALCVASTARGIAILGTQIAGFTIVGLGNAVATTRAQDAAGTAVAVATDIDAIIA